MGILIVSSQLVTTIERRALYSVCICEEEGEGRGREGERERERDGGREGDDNNAYPVLSTKHSFPNWPGHHRWTRTCETAVSSHSTLLCLSSHRHLGYQQCGQWSSAYMVAYIGEKIQRKVRLTQLWDIKMKFANSVGKRVSLTNGSLKPGRKIPL